MAVKELSGRGARVAAVANRLRALQLEQLGRPGEEREGVLAEEVRGVLKGVLPQERGEFLEALRGEFPTWEEVTQVQAGPVFDESVLSDPVYLAERLAGLKVTVDQKKRVVEILKGAGMIYTPPAPPLSPPPNPPQSPPSTPLRTPPPGPPLAAAQGPVEQAKMVLGVKDNFSVDRAVELLAVLTKLSVDVDQIVWGAWRQIAPSNAKVRRKVDLKQAAAKFVMGEGGEAAKGAQDLLHLVAGIMTAIPQVGHFVAEELSSLWPEQVKGAEITENGKGWNLERRCWERYVKLAAEKLDQAAVGDVVRKAIVETVEQ